MLVPVSFDKFQWVLASFGKFQKNDLSENCISFQTTKNHIFELLQYLKNKSSDPNVVHSIFTLVFDVWSKLPQSTG